MIFPTTQNQMQSFLGAHTYPQLCFLGVGAVRMHRLWLQLGLLNMEDKIQETL